MKLQYDIRTHKYRNRNTNKIVGVEYHRFGHFVSSITMVNQNES